MHVKRALEKLTPMSPAAKTVVSCSERRGMRSRGYTYFDASKWSSISKFGIINTYSFTELAWEERNNTRTHREWPRFGYSTPAGTFDTKWIIQIWKYYGECAMSSYMCSESLTTLTTRCTIWLVQLIGQKLYTNQICNHYLLNSCKRFNSLDLLNAANS